MSRRGPKGNVNTSKEERIKYIMSMMQQPGRFQAGCKYEELMKKFNCGIDTVKQDCAEASRAVRRQINDPDIVAIDVGRALGEVLDESRRIIAKDPGSDAALKAMALMERAGKSWCQIVGADVPIRIEDVTRRDAPTPAEALEVMRGEFGHVTPEGEDETGGA